MVLIALVEDKKEWLGKVQKALNPFGILVEYFSGGDDFIRFARDDDSELYKAVLIDWIMPGMTGPELAKELRVIKPYLKLFALTLQGDNDEIARTMRDYPFDGFLSKKSLTNGSKVREFAQEIEQAVKEVEELLISRPFADKPEHRSAYLALRASKDWRDINERIGEIANRLCDEGSFSRNRTLRDTLSTRKSGALLIENILTARRVILGEIFNRMGKLHKVEQAVGYEEEKGVYYGDPYKMYDAGFKTYCSELGLKPDEVRNRGEGILPEEERWLRAFCEKEQCKYAFPIV
jgi:CheY-like chemotaxis protein